jgi:hypothetical protein
VDSEPSPLRGSIRGAGGVIWVTLSSTEQSWASLKKLAIVDDREADVEGKGSVHCRLSSTFQFVILSV